MNKHTIGIVLPYLKSRGTEKQALRLAAGFSERGADVVVFVVQGWGLDVVYQAFESIGVRVVNVGPAVNEGKKIINFWRVFSLARLVYQHSCTVLLSRAGMSNQITGYAGRLVRIPTVVVLSGVSKKKSRNALADWVMTLMAANRLGFPHRIVSVSQEGAKNFKSSYRGLASKVIGVSNGIAYPETVGTPKRNSLEAGRFYFCFSGSLEISRKGLDILVAALELLVFEYGYGRAALVLIGAGTDGERIKKLVQNKGLSDHVLFVGEQVEPYTLMSQCQAFVLASRKEGLPNALLEAMALGMCVVAADCDTGPREIITHCEDGLLVPSEDPLSLADGMVTIMRFSSLREKLGDRAQITIKEKFSVKNMVDCYFALLTEKRDEKKVF